VRDLLKETNSMITWKVEKKKFKFVNNFTTDPINDKKQSEILSEV